MIRLKNVRLYAHHGCLHEEELIGSEYRVDLKVWGDLSLSAQTDELKDTVDYVQLNRIIKEEMSCRSKLLEHVGMRIVKRILNEAYAVQKAQVQIAKINPPIGGDVASVSLVMSLDRNGKD